MPPRWPIARIIFLSAILALALGLGVSMVAHLGPAIPVETGAPANGNGWAGAAAAVLGFLGMLTASWLAVRSSGGHQGDTSGKVRRRDPAVALLAVLQREGRLVDFLREDITAYSDAQVGAAARAIHTSCRKVLDEHLALEPVRTEAEGARIVIPNGFDPSTIRLTGKVGGKPPFRGVLRHRGWRTQELELPADAAGQDPSIIAPAEVEIT